MILDTVRNSRISTRVNRTVKKIAAKKFASRGLTISDVINIVLTTTANYGIPDYLEVPNQKAMRNIETSLKHIKQAKNGDKSIPVAKNYKDAMRMLTK